MMTSRKGLTRMALALAFAAFAAGCDGGSDLGIGSPFTGAKEALLGKPAPTPNLPDRPPLKIPPPNAPLPVPGDTSQTAAAWRPASEAQDKQPAQDNNAQNGTSSWFSGIFGSSDKKTQ